MCNDEDYTVQKASEDVSGWDFMIEQVYEQLSIQTPLDERPELFHYFFQIKTVSINSTHVKLKLSTLESLAKKSSPCFVYIFLLQDRKTIISSYIIHIQGAILELILKRIRQETAQSSLKLNRVIISLDIKKYGVRLSPSGAALRVFLDNCCGSDFRTYCRNKSDDLTSLGYTPSRYGMNMNIHAQTPGELGDIFLGLKDAKVTDLTVTKTRWDISVEDHSEQEGIIRITPAIIEECKMYVRNDSTGKPLILSGSVTSTPPFFERAARKVRVSSRWLSISFGIDSADIELGNADSEETLFTAREMVELSSIFKIAATGPLYISVVGKTLRLDNILLNKTINVEETSKSNNRLVIANLFNDIVRAVNMEDLRASFSDIHNNLRLLSGLERLP